MPDPDNDKNSREWPPINQTRNISEECTENFKNIRTEMNEDFMILNVNEGTIHKRRFPK